MLRYRDLPAHTSEVLDLTSLTVDEFAGLVPPFEAAFLGYLAKWTLHWQPRQSRRYTIYKNCPLPTPEDRLLFILVDLKAESHATAPRTRVRDAPIQGNAVDSCLTARVTQHPARLGGCALSSCGGLVQTPGGGMTTPTAMSGIGPLEATGVPGISNTHLSVRP